ncbi:helix-turn-helix domain-containing protein [Tsukamurella sp. 8F]|uniref:PucR family transcriptional regulator n=1 Tax=unclassified Tsukamurella TaxID=2633480 RepID=UPI0023BA3D6B|nr:MULTISPECIES: helix-turn-helix domain-containing protein [unclassified Tsukamurella]MDF0532371.1 helix-turn-helix domain-containing protein [Tsukamurella sp. 8J]MDF0589379.1 helix-turn-helix domain-containing protein [Tsukamurella sp. 8F]
MSEEGDGGAPVDPASAAAAVIGRMEPRLSEVTATVQRVILAQIPELRGDEQIVELLRASVEGNIGTIFAAIRHGIDVSAVTAPVAALEYARRLAQHDVTPNALVRAYRLGQQELLSLVFAEVRTDQVGADTALEVLEATFTATARYIDWISEEVIETYREELERWRESRERIRGEQIRRILSGTTESRRIDELSSILRYPLREHSVAVIMWYPQPVLERGELTGMERFLTLAARRLGAASSPLFMAYDRLTAWGWIPLSSNAVDGSVEALKRLAAAERGAPTLAIGSPRSGVAGFVRSHELAEQARAVALRGSGEEQASVASDDPGVVIAAMLGGGDLSAANVWVREVLGPLAGPAESDAHLRHTLQVFLEAGSSFTATAPLLHLHINTVKYRVRKALERRGRPLEDGRLDVEIALLLCRRLPAITGPDWRG